MVKYRQPLKPCIIWRCKNFTGYDENGKRHGARNMCWKCLKQARQEGDLIPLPNRPKKDPNIKCIKCGEPYWCYRRGTDPMCKLCYQKDWNSQNKREEAIIAARVRSVEHKLKKRKGMFDLAIAIIGSGDTTYNNAADLLNDYLPDNHVVLVPNYLTTEGMRTVVKFLSESEVNFRRVRGSKIIELLEEVKAKSSQLVILNSDGLENEISYCLKNGIPVLDLTKGLYQLRLVRDLPPDGAVSHAKTIIDSDGMMPRVEDDLVLESITARLADLEREVKELRTHIGVNETNWEPNVARQVPIGNSDTGNFTGYIDGDGNRVPKTTTTYYKSKKGKFRKAGRSKARPGEQAVELTEEEVASLDAS